MKIPLIILLAFLGCTNTKPVILPPVQDTVIVRDTVIHPIHDTVFIHRIDTFHLAKNTDSLKIINGLRDDLFIAKYRVERTRYYLKIVQRNPSQLKFLVSWINRAVN